MAAVHEHGDQVAPAEKPARVFQHAAVQDVDGLVRLAVGLVEGGQHGTDAAQDGALGTHGDGLFQDGDGLAALAFLDKDVAQLQKGFRILGAVIHVPTHQAAVKGVAGAVALVALDVAVVVDGHVQHAARQTAGGNGGAHVLVHAAFPPQAVAVGEKAVLLGLEKTPVVELGLGVAAGGGLPLHVARVVVVVPLGQLVAGGPALDGLAQAGEIGGIDALVDVQVHDPRAGGHGEGEVARDGEIIAPGEGEDLGAVGLGDAGGAVVAARVHDDDLIAEGGVVDEEIRHAGGLVLGDGDEGEHGHPLLGRGGCGRPHDRSDGVDCRTEHCGTGFRSIAVAAWELFSCITAQPALGWSSIVFLLTVR